GDGGDLLQRDLAGGRGDRQVPQVGQRRGCVTGGQHDVVLTAVDGHLADLGAVHGGGDRLADGAVGQPVLGGLLAFGVDLDARRAVGEVAADVGDAVDAGDLLAYLLGGVAQRLLVGGLHHDLDLAAGAE